MTRFGFCLFAAFSITACTTTPGPAETPATLSVRNSAPAMTPVVQDLYETPRCEMFLSNLAIAEKKTAIYPSIHAL